MNPDPKIFPVQVCLLLFLLLSLDLTAQETGFRVTGTVYSARTGLPLQDIGIRAVNDTIEPVSTNTGGEFELMLSNKDEQIQFSYPGFKDKMVFVDGRENIRVWLLGDEDVSLSDPVNMLFREV